MARVAATLDCAHGDRWPESLASMVRAAGVTRRLVAPLLSATRGGNPAVSPAGAAAVFALLGAGSAGHTRSRVADELGLDPMELHVGLRGLRRIWAADRGGRLALAHGLWVERSIPVEESFRGLAGAALVEDELLGDPEGCRRRMGEWAATHTLGRLGTVRPLPPLARLILRSAAFFEGAWSDPFDPERTRHRPFWPAAGGEALRVPTMHHEGAYGYAERDGAQLLEIPYAGGRFGLLVALPTARDGLPALLRGLDEARILAWTGALRAAEVDVFLPRFQAEQQVDLAEIFDPQGAGAVFLPDADLSPLSPEPLYVSDPVQRARIEVDERGNRAAGLSEASLPQGLDEEQRIFFAEHPFLWLLRDRESNAILFAGHVHRPSL